MSRIAGFHDDDFFDDFNLLHFITMDFVFDSGGNGIIFTGFFVETESESTSEN